MCHQMVSFAFRLCKIQFRPGLCPGPSWGSLWCSPRHLVDWGGGYPSLFPTPSTPSASCCRRLLLIPQCMVAVDVNAPKRSLWPKISGHPHQSFLHSQLGQWMPYNFFADSFHTKKLCCRLSSSEVRFLTERFGSFAILSPSLRGLRATYDDHLRLIGKRVADFLLVLNFFC